MTDHNITIEGGTSVRLPTAGKYCDRDIVITAEGGTTSDAPTYAGPYTVTPKAESQTLDTSNKLMQADLIIEEIPYSEVTNLSNGTTVTIG